MIIMIFKLCRHNLSLNGCVPLKVFHCKNATIVLLQFSNHFHREVAVVEVANALLSDSFKSIGKLELAYCVTLL